ncbi:MAG: transporter [Treponemataceae bacterium]
MDRTSVIRRTVSAATASVGPALRTTRFLVAVMVPISLAVAILNDSGILHLVAARIDPAMGFIGLSGESSLVFLSAIFLSNYSAIAVIGTLSLSPREITILAVMCLIAHNLIVESAIMKKTGSSAMKMVTLRISVALVAAYLLNLILPGHGASTATTTRDVIGSEIGLHLKRMPKLLTDWAFSSGILVLQIVILVSLLMLVQKVLEEFSLVEILGHIMKPLMMVFGLPISTSFLWIVSNIIGLAYGSAIMIERADTGKVTLTDADLFNHHAGISHSLLEDTVLYVAIGVPLFWLLIPRILLAIAVVWLERLRRVLFRRSFRVGTV